MVSCAIRCLFSSGDDDEPEPRFNVNARWLHFGRLDDTAKGMEALLC